MGDRRHAQTNEVHNPLSDVAKAGQGALDKIHEQQRTTDNQKQAQTYNEAAEKGSRAGHDVRPGEKADPSAVIERSAEAYKPPKAGETKQVIQNHKDATSNTGTARPMEITDAKGNVLKGQTYFDKKTGEHHFVAQTENGLSHFKIIEGGRTLQPTDAKGNPVGEGSRIRNNRVENPNTTSPAERPAKGPEGDRPKLEQHERGERGERGDRGTRRDGSDQSRPGFEPGKGPSDKTVPGTDQPGGRLHGTHPDRPTLENNGRNNTPPDFPPRKTDDQGNRGNRDFNDNGRRDWREPKDARDIKEGREPRESREPRDLGSKDLGRRDANNPAGSPQDRPYPGPDSRRQHDARVAEAGQNYNNNQERAVADARRAEIAARMEQVQAQQMQNRGDFRGPDGRPGPGAAPDGRPMNFNPEGRIQSMRPDGQPMTRAEVIARAMEERQMGRMPGQDGRINLAVELQNPGHRAAMLDMMAKFEQGKLAPTGREGDMGAFLRGLKPNEFSAVKDFLSQDRLGAMQISRLDARAQAQLTDMFTLSRGGRLEGSVEMSLRGTRMQDLALRDGLDRIPSAEQSRMMLKDLFAAGRDSRADRATLTGSMEQLNLSRLLGQRELENSTGKIANSFTLKTENAQLVKDLLDKVGGKDLLSLSKLEAVKNLETTSLKPSENKVQNSNTETVGKNIERAQTASVLDNVLAQRNNNEKAEFKPADIVKMANDRAADQISQQPNVVVKSAETLNPETKSYLPNEEKNQNNKHSEREGKDKQEPNKPRELSPEEMAVLITRKLKDQKDKADKEKDQASENSKKDPHKRSRQRYRIRQNDTLHGIAVRYLHDENLAAAIYHLNRNVIPLTSHSGKHYANPQVNSLIWIPGDEDIEMFRNSGGHKKYSHIGFKGAKYSSAEEELSARFGTKWSADNKNATNENRDERRRNVESVLGTFRKEESNGRIKYTVRLGDTLKSIALKHPALQQVELWKLLAQVNEITTETDIKGTPLASLKRGTALQLPTTEEIEQFKNRGSASNNVSTFEDSGESKSGLTAADYASFTPFGFTPPVSAPVISDPLTSLLKPTNPIDERLYGRAVEHLSDDSVEDSETAEEEDHDPSIAAFQPQSQKVWERCFDKFRAESTARSVGDLEEFMSQVNGSETLILSETARLVAAGSSETLEAGYELSLEILADGEWESIVKYEISDAGCSHQTFDGSYRRTRPLPLSSSEVFELAKNDLARNWQNHVSAFSN